MDKAILYNVTLQKVNRRINELKTIGFNMDEFIRIKEDIINKNKTDVQKSYDFTSPSLALGQTAFLEQGYTNSINELNKLYDKLLDYEIYVMAYHTTKLVKEFLESDNKSIENFTKYQIKIEQVLKNLHSSKTLDYAVEGPAIEEIYSVVYLFIKEEIEMFCYSTLLNKLGEVDKYYIDKLVRKDIEQIDLRDEKNKLISIKTKEIASKGFEATYADSDLIMAIVNSKGINSEKRKLALDNLDRKIYDYAYCIEQIYNEVNNHISMPNDKKEILKSLSKNSLKLILNSALATFLAFVALKSGKWVATEKTTTFMTTTTTYNPLDKEPYVITEEYTPTRDDSLYVLDYGPVVTEGKRTFTEYDLSDYQEYSFEELYNMDLSSLIIPEENSVLEDKDLYLESLTNEAFRIIRKIEVNLEDVKENVETNITVQILFTILFELLAVVIYIFYALLLLECDIDYLPIIKDLKNIYEDLKELAKNNQDKKEYQEKLNEIINRLETLRIENKDILEKAESSISYLEKNHEYDVEINNLIRKLVLIKDKQNEIIDNYYKSLD